MVLPDPENLKMEFDNRIRYLEILPSQFGIGEILKIFALKIFTNEA